LVFGNRVALPAAAVDDRTTQSITPPFGTDKEVQDNDNKTTHDPEANAFVSEG
jgi:hypothetical protein